MSYTSPNYPLHTALGIFLILYISSLILSLLLFQICWHNFFCTKLNMEPNSFQIPVPLTKLLACNILWIVIFEGSEGEVISYCTRIFTLHLLSPYLLPNFLSEITSSFSHPHMWLVWDPLPVSTWPFMNFLTHVLDRFPEEYTFLHFSFFYY